MTSEFFIAMPVKETVHLKPTCDAEGNWSLVSTALRKDANGWHDRPLLTPASLADKPRKAGT